MHKREIQSTKLADIYISPFHLAIAIEVCLCKTIVFKTYFYKNNEKLDCAVVLNLSQIIKHLTFLTLSLTTRLIQKFMQNITCSSRMTYI
jgi:hypothetical protein